MFGSDLSSGSGGPGGGTGVTRSVGVTRGVDGILARGQALVDTPPTEDGHTLAWHIEAMLVGDVTAILAAAVREARHST